jgi:hypothetical protein
MQPKAGNQLTRSVFLFGAVDRGPYGYMTFSEDGKITTYENSNEATYCLNADGILSFLDTNGVVTSTLAPLSGNSLAFRPHQIGRHYLEPVLTLAPPPTTRVDLPPVMLNTLPKSGTYMVAQALQDVGYTPVDLHLSSQFLHDNRGIPPEEIHWSPDERALPIPARAAASLLRPGEFMVGHIDSSEELRALQRLPLRLLNVVRNPYSQILSMMKFRHHKVKPTEKDLIWQSLTGLEQVKAFVISHPVDYWLSISRTITSEFPYLRFEDLRQGRVARSATDAEMVNILSQGLKTAIGKRTSTLMRATPKEQFVDLKDPTIWAFLGSLGMHDYAQSIWPDAP